MHRHRHRADTDQPGGNPANRIGGIVNQREHLGDGSQQDAEHNTNHNIGGNQLAVVFPNLLHRMSRAQHLSHHNAHRVAAGNKGDTGQIKNGGGDIHGRHHIQTAGGVALIQKCHTAGPQRLIQQQRHTLYGNVLQQSCGNIHTAVGTLNEHTDLLMPVGPDCHDGKLHIAGNGSCQRRTPNTHFRRAEMAENQHIVQHQIHQHRNHTGRHGHGGFTGFTKGAGIGIGQRERNKTKKHHMQILKSVLQHLRRLRGVTFALQIKADQCGTKQIEQAGSQQRQCRADQNLKPEGMPDSLMVIGAIKLGGKNTRTGAGAKNAEVINKNQTVYNGNTAHLQAAHLSDHDVVQHGNEIGDAVLDDDRNGDQKESFIKCLVGRNLFQHKKPQIQQIQPVL